MNYTDKHIIESYSGLLEGLNPSSKLKLIESLSKSLETQRRTKEEDFYRSFGAFASDKSAEKIVADIKSGRRFRDKEIKF